MGCKAIRCSDIGGDPFDMCIGQTLPHGRHGDKAQRCVWGGGGGGGTLTVGYKDSTEFPV